MLDLKKCPFCGGEARLFVGDGVRVLCQKCYATTRILTDAINTSTNAVKNVIEAWNRRVDNGQ